MSEQENEKNITYRSYSIDILDLRVGLKVIGFEDVPLRFRILQKKSIEFLSKYLFKDVVVIRDGKKCVLTGELLKERDRVISLGTMQRHININEVKHCELMTRMGFKKIKVVVIDAIKFREACEEKKLLGPSELSKLLENDVLSSKYYGQVGNEQDSQADKKEVTPAESLSTQTNGTLKEPTHLENIRSNLHEMQDLMEKSEKVFQQGEDLLQGIFQQGNFKPKDMEKVEEVTEEICRILTKNRHASSVITVLRDHDEYTFRHCVDVANQALVALSFMNKYSDEELKAIGIGALLHDIGKSKIPPGIINKPGRLTENEWLHMKMHPAYSADIMTNLGLSKLQIFIGHYHHVLKNGRGYPKMSFEALPIPVRMVTISDVYQALITKRPYKKTDTPFLALKKIKQVADSEFDSRLVEVFIKAFGIYPPGSFIELNDGRKGFVISNNNNSFLPIVLIVFDENEIKMKNTDLIDLSEESVSEFSIKKVIDHNTFFKNDEAVEIFANLDF